MTLHNTPVRLDIATLVDERPHERFVNADRGADPEARDRYQAMVVMEVWEAAYGPEPAAVVADTLPVDQAWVGYFMSMGQTWLWEAIVNPAVWVQVADSRVELAEVLEDEDTRPLRALASRIRRQRLGDGQYVALTLREMHTIRPIVETIPDVYAVRDRLEPLIRSAWWDAAAEQHKRFRADRTAMDLAASPWRWADLYGYQRACTVLEQVLTHGQERHPAPYLGDGSKTITSVDRLGELHKAVTAQERDGLSWEERDRADGWVMPRDNREALSTRPGTWRWGQANA